MASIPFPQPFDTKRCGGFGGPVVAAIDGWVQRTLLEECFEPHLVGLLPLCVPSAEAFVEFRVDGCVVVVLGGGLDGGIADSEHVVDGFQACHIQPTDDDDSQPGIAPQPGCIGTVMYFAPEIERKPYNERVDIWALGVVA
ncbi:hypothetical protein BJ546DRAFT_1057927 [Cryomyces antarcticus]